MTSHEFPDSNPNQMSKEEKRRLYDFLSSSTIILDGNWAVADAIQVAAEDPETAYQQTVAGTQRISQRDAARLQAALGRQTQRNDEGENDEV
jgi:hypothetical protein